MTSRPFRSPGRLSWVLMSLLGAWLLAQIAYGIASVGQRDLLAGLERGESPSEAAATASDERMEAIQVISLVLFILTGIVWLVWFDGIYRNAACFRGRPLEHGAGWAVGAYCVPFLNLVRPYQMMREAWDRSAPAGQRSGFPLVGAWWSGWILTNLCSRLVVSMAKRADDLPELQSVTRFQIADALIGVGAAALAILLVHRHTARQIACASTDAMDRAFS